MNNYEKNTDALRHNEEFLKWLETPEKNDSWYEARGEKNLWIDKRGKKLLAYDDNYLREIEGLKKLDMLHSDRATLVIGAGAGHLLDALLQSAAKGHRIVLIEPVAGILKIAFQNFDFSQHLKENKLFIVNEKTGVANIIASLDASFVIQDWGTFADAYTQWCEEYTEISNYTREILDQHRCGIGTVIGAGEVIAEDDVKNLPYMIDRPGVRELKDFYKGRAVVCVATGPSLQKNIHVLKEYQDRVVIVAVAQALRVLLAHDIRPDFITTVDYGEVNFEHFKGLLHSDVPLVALNRSYHEIIKYYEGPIFALGTIVPGYEATIHGIIAEKGTLEQGGSVAHLSYQFAKHLGGNPIILIGQNLSYDNNLSHVGQVDAGGHITTDANGMITWHVDDPRSSVNKMEHHYGNTIYVPGILGDVRPTNMGLASFITTFEAMFEQDKNDIEIYNATEHGANLKGAKNVTLRKVLEKHASRWNPKKSLKNISKKTSKKEYQKYIKLLEEEIETLSEISPLVEKALFAADKMIEVGEKIEGETAEKEYKKWSDENETHAKKAHFYAIKNPLMGLHMYAASRKIYTRALNVEGGDEHLRKDFEDRKRRVERSKFILQAARASSEKLLKLYKNAVIILMEKMDGKFILKPYGYKVDFSDAKEYLAKGNWAHPFLDIVQGDARDYPESKELLDIIYATRNKEEQTAREEELRERRQDQIDYLYFIEEAKKSQKTGDLEEALKYLQNAEKLYPEKIAARWGIATTLAMLGREKESLNKYEQLEKDFPEQKRLSFEKGIVSLNFEQEKGLEYLYNFIKENTEYAYFFAKLGGIYSMRGNPGDDEIAQDCYSRYLISYPDDEEISKKLG